MSSPESPSPTYSRLLMIASLVIIAFAFRYAKDILIPLALGVLFSFLLSPLVARLEKWHVRRLIAVLVVVGLAFILIGSIGYVVAFQVIDLGVKLPQYKKNIYAKVESLSHPGGLEKVTANLKDMEREITRLAASTTTATLVTTGTTTTVARNPLVSPVKKTSEDQIAPVQSTPVTAVELASNQPLKVQIVDAPYSPLFLLNSTIAPLLQPLGMAAVVIILTIFMLIYHEDMRDRLIRLIGEGQLNVTTQALDDAARRVSRYLLMQLIVNATYGIPVAIVLYFIGLPNALLWGVLATLLRFIPYLGPWIAASFPLALSLAVFDDWSHFWLTAGFFIILELISNNVIEVMLYSSQTGISRVALVVSAAFWTWVWGGIGLVIATPLTVCLVVLGKYVPQLAFLNILFGDQPVLALEIRIYQRLLGLHIDEARRLADEHLAKTSIDELYESVLLPVLGLAEHDRQRGAINEQQFNRILSHMREIIEDLGERQYQPIDSSIEKTATVAEETRKVKLAVALPSDYGVLCLAARDTVDEMAGLMLSQLLMARGYRAESCSSQALASEMLELAGQAHIRLVCISALPPFADMHARYICKRLRTRYPELLLIAGLWNLRDDPRWAAERLGGTCSNVAVSFTAALSQIASLIAPLINREKPQDMPGETSGVQAPDSISPVFSEFAK